MAGKGIVTWGSAGSASTQLFNIIISFVGTKSEMENFEGKFVSGEWTPTFVGQSAPLGCCSNISQEPRKMR